MHQIGVGVLGPVYRTYEPEHDRLVAVKAFHLDITPELAGRFAAALTAVASSALDHDALVRPIAAGLSDEGVPYLAQEYVAAESLDVAMRHYAPAPLATALPFMTQLADGLDHAHGRGVVHGALHLRDIFVTPDRARAGGFGVVKALESLGLRGPIRRPYTAPERIAAAAWGAEADRFALAAIAYELLTGKRPAGAGDQVAAPLEGVEGVFSHAALKQVFARALAEHPARRFASCGAFVSAIRAAADEGAAEEPREPPPLRRERSTVAVFPARVQAPATGAQGAESGVQGAGHVAQGAASKVQGAGFGVRDAASEMPDPASPPQYAGKVKDRQQEGDLFATLGRDEHPQEAPARSPEASPSEKQWTLGEPDLQLVDRWMEHQAARPEEPQALEPDLPAESGFEDQQTTEEADEAEADVAARPEWEGEEAADDEGVETETGVAQPKRAILPMAIAIVVGTLAAYIAAMALGVGGGPRTPRDEVLPSGASETSVQDVSERAVSESPVEAPAGEPVATPNSSRATPATEEPAAVSPPTPLAEPLAIPEPVAEPAASEPPAVQPEVPAPRPLPRPAPPPPPARSQPSPSAGSAPPVARTGWILVRTTPPGAQVSVNGEPRGTTPLSLPDVDMGSHSVRIALTGYEPQEQRVELTDAQPVVALNVELRRSAAASPATPSPAAPSPAPPVARTGALFVESRPAGAAVQVDGRLVGTTPLLLSSVAAGPRSIRIELQGYEAWTTTVDVVAAQQTRVAASLDRTPR